MKVSLNWLRELVDAPLDGEKAARALTMAGLEVESRTPFAPLQGVIAAEVRGKRPHPNAAKLTLVDVFDGRETTQVVCGAPNVPEPGSAQSIVLWARPGATLPNGLTLAPKEVRGVLSPGMLCAEDELGFGSSHEGIVLLSRLDGLHPGDDLARKLGLPDEIWEVNVTPNRPDCLGHVGLARELCALIGCRLKLPGAPSLPALLSGGQAPARVELRDAEGCPRYTAVCLEGVKVAPSPLALRLRLQSLGVRAISNVVDATNLVLLETGQPLHAFDLDKLGGRAIVVRRAKDGETITTLDGQERALTGDDVAICDESRPVAVAGVMGGATSEVSATTTRVLLESAYFQPARVRRTSKRLGLHTEASHRFERGVDPDGVPQASARCAQLFVELAGARVVGPFIDAYPKPIARARLSLRPARTRALLGIDVGADEQTRLLSALGLEVKRDGELLTVEVPPRRPDLTREVDLIEEIARLYGYDRVPVTVPRLREAPGPSGDPVGEAAREALRGLGLDEVITYAFVGPKLLERFALPAAVRIQNPLREEQSAMRTRLSPGLVLALERNLLRGQSDVRIFELGQVFLPPQSGAPGARPQSSRDVTLPTERRHLAALIAGHEDGWLKPGAPLDFYDVKGMLEQLMDALGHTVQLEPSRETWLHPGVQARVLADAARNAVGVIGELHPDLRQQLGVEARAFVLELDLDALGPGQVAAMAELPRFPAVSRDLSFFVDERTPAGEIAGILGEVKDPLCVEVRVLEDYREKGRVPEGKKGMLWSFTYRAPDRTLTDAEVQSAHDALLGRLRARLAIDPR